MERYTARIENVAQETPLDRTIILRVLDAPPDAFRYLPGQFVVVTDPAMEKPPRRAYSLSSAPEEGELLHLTVRDMGDFGAHLYRLEKGTNLLVNPPQGRFTMPDDPSANLVLAAGGSGVTPFRSYAVSLAASGAADRRVTLFQSARVPGELLFRKTFEAIAEAEPWFEYVPTVTRADDDDEWAHTRGRIDATLVKSAMADSTSVQFHACGPASFVKAMFGIAEALGVPPGQRKKEQWG